MDSPVLSDEELVVLLRSGQAGAIREIYNRYWQEILLVIYRKLHDQELAEELTQNLFVNLWEKRETADIKQLRFYLFGAVKFSILNHYKALNIQEKHLDNYRLNKQDQENITEKEVLLHDLVSAIEKGVKLLPVKTQQVFRLSRMQHHSVKEISSDLNISEKTVEYHITRSVKVLRLYLKDYLLVFMLMLLLLH